MWKKYQKEEDLRYKIENEGFKLQKMGNLKIRAPIF